jgi:hypothetical protein
MKKRNVSFKAYTIGSIFVLTAIMLSVVFVGATGITLLCLQKNQVAKFSLCNPTMDDKVCTCTSSSCSCQLCVNEISSGVYCPASPNLCNVGSFECTYLQLDNSTNITNSTNSSAPINITLVSPADGYSTKTSGVSFSYKVTNSTKVTSCYLYANGISIASNSTKITSLANTLSKSFSPGSYQWFIRCYVNDKFTDSPSRNLIIQGSSPNQTSITISLINPDNNSTLNNSNLVSFIYNVSNSSSINQCSLMIDGNSVLTNNNLQYNFSVNLSEGNYSWNINCIDNSAKIWQSESRLLSIQNASSESTPVVTPTPGPSGGGGSVGGGGGS